VTGPELADALRLVAITDRRLAAPRSVEQVVREALAAGARTIQLRDKGASAHELAERARALLELTRPAGALLIVNDRVDVALATGADGVHLGPDDLPVSDVRRHVPQGFVIGYSSDDPETARRAETEGASYLGCGAVWGTDTKDVGGEAIGLVRLRAVVESVRIPVVAIGGVTPERARAAAATGAAGAAVVRAVMAAPDVADAVRRLLEPFSSSVNR
jgi:thiamine-phosphate pyrophosphorylase